MVVCGGVVVGVMHAVVSWSGQLLCSTTHDKLLSYMLVIVHSYHRMTILSPRVSGVDENLGTIPFLTCLAFSMFWL